ncbi:inositol hexakisphosphate kinase 2-like [Plectropomus leopardus]|uniref:inositol hexakisphosphate kinase 2-like n=1 Tax=Plectropomus leopardus TaxID=160734 RepID=UPI001C4ABE19|nr:inositol hexakisphosphate kinase 2-like [Plectropomus leopardus]
MGPAVEAPAQKAMDAEQQQNQLQHQQCHVENEVLLEPFLHQVGGHCCLLRLGEKTICKPLLPSEHWFYKNVPAALKTFTPEYRGVVTASFEEDAEGNHCFKAYPLQSDSEEDLENKKPSTNSEPKSEMLCENYSKDGQSHRFCTDKDRSVYKQQQEHKVLYFRLEHSHNNAVPQLKHKPWIVEGQKYHLKKLKDKVMHCNRCKFILLENLTWQHTLPCVLDLKMGTQHYGDEEPEERKAMKIQQCQHSTSNLIGMYISGMQVYQCDTGQLMFISKFLGRRLSLQDFKDSLFQFFNSGRHLRRELFSPVLRRLRELKAAVETCESYRFYSSSLLIIYNAVPLQKHSENGSLKEEEDEDEDEDVEVERPPLVDVKMIDFAHATCSNYQGNSLVYEGTDSSYVSGLQNLITIISELENHSTD